MARDCRLTVASCCPGSGRLADALAAAGLAEGPIERWQEAALNGSPHVGEPAPRLAWRRTFVGALDLVASLLSQHLWAGAWEMFFPAARPVPGDARWSARVACDRLGRGRLVVRAKPYRRLSVLLTEGGEP